MSTTIWYHLKHGAGKGGSWEKAVGYTVADLKRHLEALFVDGMTWENMGGWHIDHKRPCASFSYTSPADPEFRECWSLENLQPLWKVDNLRKGSKFPAVA
jgi:hypothetical protein